MAILPPRTGDGLLDTLLGTQDIWGLTLYARLTSFLDVTWPALRAHDADRWVNTLLLTPPRNLCPEVWWYVWEHGVASDVFGPWCPTRRLGPPQPPRYWWYTAYFGQPSPLGLQAPCGHPLQIEAPVYKLPWRCQVCGSNVMFPIHRGPR